MAINLMVGLRPARLSAEFKMKQVAQGQGHGQMGQQDQGKDQAASPTAVVCIGTNPGRAAIRASHARTFG